MSADYFVSGSLKTLGEFGAAIARGWSQARHAHETGGGIYVRKGHRLFRPTDEQKKQLAETIEAMILCLRPQPEEMNCFPLIETVTLSSDHRPNLGANWQVTASTKPDRKPALTMGDKAKGKTASQAWAKALPPLVVRTGTVTLTQTLDCRGSDGPQRVARAAPEAAKTKPRHPELKNPAQKTTVEGDFATPPDPRKKETSPEYQFEGHAIRLARQLRGIMGLKLLNQPLKITFQRIVPPRPAP